MESSIPSYSSTCVQCSQVGGGGSGSGSSSSGGAVSPATDFYTYINAAWQRSVHLPPYAGTHGVSEEIEEDVRTRLLAAIQEQRKENSDSPLTKLATSFLHTASQKHSVVDLQRVLNRFDCIETKEDLAAMIGTLNKLQTRAPLSLVVGSNPYKSSDCTIYLYEPQLGLPSPQHYLASATGPRNTVLLKYSQLLEKLGALMNIERLESAIPLEADLSTLLTPNEIMLSDPVSFRTLARDYAAIPWEAMLTAWGLAKDVYERATYSITNAPYLHRMAHMFRTLSLESWRTWMRAQVCITFIEYLPPPFDDLHYELYGKELNGTAEKLPQKYLTLKVLQTYTPHDLGRLFVERAVPPATKRHAVALVERLQTATIERLRAVRWMSEATRRRAIEKVSAMAFQIAYPRHWKSETRGTPIDPTRPLLNVLTLAARDSAAMLSDLHSGGCAKGEDDWEDGVFEVNAYYYPEGNRMVVPAGILRPPFFDLEKSDAWNLGGIGSAIGHEITHAFDVDGRMYNAKGDLEEWWTETDVQAYRRVTRALVTLFDGAPYMGGKVDGKLTLSENLADLGGLAIALHALQSQLPADPERRKAAYVDFFTSYATSWRTKDRPQKAKQALLLDVHAPAALRVNLIVRQFEEFYTAFAIAPGAAGYIPPEMRVMLW